MTERWDHTAALQATIYSVAGAKGVSPQKLHPYRSRLRARIPVTKREARETASEIKAILKSRKKG